MSSHRVLRVGSVISAFSYFVLIAGCGSDSSQTDWVLTEEPDGNTLHLNVAIGGSCDAFDDLDVNESPELINIQAYYQESGSGCTDDLRWEEHEVKLDRPLGERRLEGCDSPRPARDGASPEATRFRDCSSVVGLAPGDTLAACGPWFSLESALGRAIAQQYGEISSCNELEEGYRVITTLGTAPGESDNQGVIGVYQCDLADEGCLRGTADHPFSGWEFITPPYSGAVTWVAHPTNYVLILSSGGKQLTFNFATGEFAERAAQ
jgi:hypothetical protein